MEASMDDPIKWQRHRFKADRRDYRPVTFPPPGPYWCTGHGLPHFTSPPEEGYSVLVAYLPAGESVKTYWPEAWAITTEDVDGITFTDRFPCPKWWSPSSTDEQALQEKLNG
jgi:hypothetical protein